MPSSSAATASPGNSHNVVGVHYKVGKKIGEGSFGIIYEGKHPMCCALLENKRF